MKRIQGLLSDDEYVKLRYLAIERGKNLHELVADGVRLVLASVDGKDSNNGQQDQDQ